MASANKLIPYFSAERGQTEVRLLTARLLRRLAQGSPTDKGLSQKDVLQQLMRERKEETAISFTTREEAEQIAEQLQHQAFNAAKRAARNLNEKANTAYLNGYAEEISLKELSKQILKAAASFSLTQREQPADGEEQDGENGPEEVKERDFDASLLEAGIGQLTPGVKLFLGLVTTGKGKDERPIPFVATMSQMYRVLENSSSPEQMLQKLRDHAAEDGQENIAAVLQAFEEQKDNPMLLAGLYQDFSRILVDPETLLANSADGSVQLISELRKNQPRERLGAWHQGVTRHTPEARTALIDKTAKALAVVSSAVEKGAKEQALTTRLAALGTSLNALGIDLHPGFLSSLAKGKNPDYALRVEKGSPEEEAGLRDFQDDLNGILTELDAPNGQPFFTDNKETEGPQKETKSAYAIRAARQLALAEAKYQQNLLNVTFQTPDKKTGNAYVKPSELIIRGRQLEAGKLPQIVDPEYSNNLIARQLKQLTGKKKSGVFRLSFLNGLDFTDREMDGKTFKNFSAQDYWLMVFGAYRHKRILPMQFEAKSSTFLATLGSSQFSHQGVLTKEGLHEFLELYRQDLALNKRVLKELSTLPLSKLEHGFHFKEYGADNKPILLSADEVRAIWNSTDVAAKQALPRGLQLVQNSHLEKYSREQLTDELVQQAAQQQVEENVAKLEKEMLEAGLSFADAGQAKLLGLPDKANRQHFLMEFVLQDYLYSNAYSQLLRGSEAHFKDAVDLAKRAASLIAAGPDLGDGSYNSAILATEYKFINEKTMQQWAPTDRENELEAKDKKERTKEETEELKALQKNRRKVDRTDAQGHSTAKRQRDILTRQGRVTPEEILLLRTLEMGQQEVAARLAPLRQEYATEPLTPAKLLKRTDANLDALRKLFSENELITLITEGLPTWNPDVHNTYNSIKNVVSAPELYGKMSLLTLFRDATSNYIKGRWVAKPGYEYDHQLREWMEENQLDEVYYDTAVKLGRKGVNFRNTTGGWDAPNVNTLQNRNWRLQMENPSGKDSTIFGSQLLQLLDSELLDSQTLELDGKPTTVGALRAEREAILAALREGGAHSFEALRTGKLRGQELLLLTLEEQTAKDGTTAEAEFWSQLPGGGPRYSQDLPQRQREMEKALTTLFNNRVARLKAPGGKLTLVKSMNQVVVDTSGKVVHDLTKEDHEQEYLDTDGQLKLGYALRDLVIHRPVLDAAGNVVRVAYAEVIISEERLQQHQISYTDADGKRRKRPMTKRDLAGMTSAQQTDVLTQLGYRIPTQSYHSMIPFRVVGFLPAYCGSIILAPSEITYLSGAGYGGDSLFTLWREFYEDPDGKLHVYGRQTTTEGRHAEWLAYHLKNNADIKLSLRRLTEQDARLEMALQRQKEAKAAVAPAKAARETAQEVAVAAIAEAKKQQLPQRPNQFRLDAAAEQAQLALLKAKKAEEEAKGLAAATATTISQRRQQLQEEVFETLGLAYTAQEFQALPELQQLTPCAHHTRLMDLHLGLLTSALQAESLFTPVTTARTEIAANLISEATGVGGKQSVPANSILGKFRAFLVNMTSKANVSMSASGNATGAFLAKHGVRLAKPVNFPGILLTGFDGLEELDIVLAEKTLLGGTKQLVIIGYERQRKADGSSTNVSADTDNAKLVVSLKLNLTRDTRGVSILIQQLGGGLTRSYLFIAQPIIRELAGRLSRKDSPFPPPGGTSAYDIGQALNGELQGQIGRLRQTLGNEVKVPVIAGDQGLVDSLHPLTADERGTVAELAHLLFQQQVLATYHQLSHLSSKTLIPVGQVLGLNKGIGVDLTEMGKVRDAVTKVTDGGAISIGAALAKEKGLSASLAAYRQLLASLPQELLTETPLVVSVQALAERAGLPTRGKTDKRVPFRRHVLGVLMALGLNRRLVADGEQSLFERMPLLVPTSAQSVVQQLLDLRRKYPALLDNPFFSSLRSVNGRVVMKSGKLTADPFARTLYGSYTKVDAELRELREDGFMEMWNIKNWKDPRRIFAESLVYQSLLKDGWEFKNDSFISLLPPAVFKQASQVLMDAREAINVGDIASLGISPQELEFQALASWFSHPDNQATVQVYHALDQIKRQPDGSIWVPKSAPAAFTVNNQLYVVSAVGQNFAAAQPVADNPNRYFTTRHLTPAEVQSVNAALGIEAKPAPVLALEKEQVQGEVSLTDAQKALLKSGAPLVIIGQHEAGLHTSGDWTLWLKPGLYYADKGALKAALKHDIGDPVKYLAARAGIAADSQELADFVSGRAGVFVSPVREYTAPIKWSS